MLSFPAGKLTFPKSENRVQNAGLFKVELRYFTVKVVKKLQVRRRFQLCFDCNSAQCVLGGFPLLHSLFPSPENGVGKQGNSQLKLCVFVGMEIFLETA